MKTYPTLIYIVIKEQREVNDYYELYNSYKNVIKVFKHKHQAKRFAKTFNEHHKKYNEENYFGKDVNSSISAYVKSFPIT